MFLQMLSRRLICEGLALRHIGVMLSAVATPIHSKMSTCVLGKRSKDESPSDEEIKRRKTMEEIEQSLPKDLSKNQRKKEIKRIYRELMKPQWKQIKKEKDRKKRQERRKNPNAPKAAPVKSMYSSDASQLRIAIDMNYDHLMTDKDIAMVVKQCQRCYSENRRATKPIQLYLTSVNGKCRERFEQAVSGFAQWEVHSKTEQYVDVFKKEDVVFLTSESPNTITELDQSKVYVIGGLVDHNNHKGYCYNEAIKMGVAHSKLPISDHVTLNSRTVLAINHVFEVLLSYEQHKDWKRALLEAIPSRKIMKTCSATNDTVLQETKIHT